MENKTSQIGNRFADYGGTLDFIKENFFAFHSNKSSADYLICFIKFKDINYLIDPDVFDQIDINYKINHISLIIPLIKRNQSLYFMRWIYPKSYSSLLNNDQVKFHILNLEYKSKSQLFNSLWHLVLRLNR